MKSIKKRRFGNIFQSGLVIKFPGHIMDIHLKENKNMSPKKEVGIGLVHVKHRRSDKFFQGSKGAYVNVLAWAASILEYKKLVNQDADEYGMDVKKMEEIEPFSKRLRESRVQKSLLRLVEIDIVLGFILFISIYLKNKCARVNSYSSHSF